MSEADPRIYSNAPNPAVISLPIVTSPKGLKTFELDLHEYELIETGTKTKEVNGVPTLVHFMKFIIK